MVTSPSPCGRVGERPKNKKDEKTEGNGNEPHNSARVSSG